LGACLSIEVFWRFNVSPEANLLQDILQIQLFRVIRARSSLKLTLSTFDLERFNVTFILINRRIAKKSEGGDEQEVEP
jgi:hypothetical protein